MVHNLILDHFQHSLPFCKGCRYRKQTRKSHKAKKEKIRSTIPGVYLHSDICGAFSPASIGKATYYLLFKNDYSGFRFIFFLKHKSETLNCFKS